MECGCFPGHHIGGVDGSVQQPAGGRGFFLNTVGARLNFAEYSHTCGIGFSGVGLSRLNVGDRNHGSRQVHAGIGCFLDTKIAIGFIFKNDLCNLAVDDLNILRRFRTQQIEVRRDTLIHGIISGESQRDADLTGCVCSKGTDGSTVRANHFKHSAA